MQWVLHRHILHHRHHRHHRQHGLRVQPGGSNQAGLTKQPDRCEHIYFDLGSNIGVQIRKLFEPEKYPGAKVLPQFDRLFGPAPGRRESVCAFGFEANPAHKARLADIEKCYHDVHGWNAHYAMRAVSTVDGEHITFYSDPSDTHEDWGAGTTPALIQNKTAMIEHKVETVDIAAFILDTVERYQPKAVFVKMDIEGTEYDVLPHMMQQGVFCQNVVTAMVIEWHGWRARRNTTLNQGTMLQQLGQAECNITEIVAMDDETFLHDNKDFPEGC